MASPARLSTADTGSGPPSRLSGRRLFQSGTNPLSSNERRTSKERMVPLSAFGELAVQLSEELAGRLTEAHDGTVAQLHDRIRIMRQELTWAHCVDPTVSTAETDSAEFRSANFRRGNRHFTHTGTAEPFSRGPHAPPAQPTKLNLQVDRQARRSGIDQEQSQDWGRSPSPSKNTNSPQHRPKDPYEPVEQLVQDPGQTAASSGHSQSSAATTTLGPGTITVPQNVYEESIEEAQDVQPPHEVPVPWSEAGSSQCLTPQERRDSQKSQTFLSVVNTESFKPAKQTSRQSSITSANSIDCVNFVPFKPWDIDEGNLKRLRMEPTKSMITAGIEKRRISSQPVGKSKFMLHPQGRLRLGWELLALACLLYDFAVMPLEAFEMPTTGFFVLMNWIIVIYWTMDVAASLTTGVYINGKLSFRFRDIAREYVKTWLIFDCCVLIPEWIILSVGSDLEALGLARIFKNSRIIRVLRLLRLVRVVKLDKVLGEIKVRLNGNVNLLLFRMMKLTLGTVLIIHFCACAWYAIGRASENKSGWIYLTGVVDAGFGERYLSSFIWSMARLHPASFSQNLKLQATEEKVFAIAISLVALCGGGFFISSITNTMAQLQSFREQRTRKLFVIREYVQANKISIPLAVRVKRYVEKSLNRKLREQYHAELTQMLPTALITDLHFESWAPCLFCHIFFGNLSSQGYQRVVWHLSLDALAEVPFLIGDRVFTIGDPCNRMLFVLSGDLNYAKSPSSYCRASQAISKGDDLPEDPTAVHVGKNSAICEPALWTHWENRGELYATMDSTLLTLHAEHFLHIVSDNKRALAIAVERCREIIDWLNAHESIEYLSDLVPRRMTCVLSPGGGGGRRPSTESLESMSKWSIRRSGSGKIKQTNSRKTVESSGDRSRPSLN